MDTKELMHQWLRGLRILSIAHYRAAKHYARFHRALGVPVVILTSTVGTTVLINANSPKNLTMQIMAGVLSMLAAALAGIQTFLGYSHLAEKHIQAAADFGELRRSLEQEIAFSAKKAEELSQFLESIRKRWHTLSEESPAIPDSIYQKVLDETNDMKRQA